MNANRVLTVLIMVGLLAGVIVGQLLHDPAFSMSMNDAEHAHGTVIQVFHFVGNTIFLGLLKMLVIPLIGTSVIMGVTSVGDFRELGKIGTITVAYYLGTMFIAVVIGLILVTTVKPGEKITTVQTEQAKEEFDADTDTQSLIADRPSGILGAMQNLVEQIIPTNIVRAAAEGKALPVIFFAILFGIALTTMGEKGQTIVALISAMFDAIMKLVHVVIWLTPMGVFALLAWAVARVGLGVFADAIGTYMITVLVGLSIHALVILPVICFVFARCNPFRYMHQMRQALLTAMGTDSSSATLPVTIECATEFGGVGKKSAGFVLPLGATINMDGTALYEGVAVVFLAQAYGIELSFSTLVLVAITATFAAIGAAGIPSAGLVTMVIVVDTVNGTLAGMPGSPSIPIAAIGLIVGVDRILDMFRTTVNVWGDAVGAKVVDRMA